MKKYYIVITIIAIIIIIPFVAHSILLKTSNTYNEILDKRAFSQLEKSLTSWEFASLEVYTRTEELGSFGFMDGDKEEFYQSMEYHSTKWNLPDSKWTYRTKVENRVLLGNGKIRYETTVFLSEGSDLFTVYYNDRLFYVTLPKLKKLIDNVENAGGMQ